jgi:hypothetical protein
MPEFINSGRVIDVALLMVVLEMTALLAYRARRRNSLATADVLAHLCAAAGLLGAAHLLLARAIWPYPALALSAALVAHIVALRFRWRRPRSVNLTAAEGRFTSGLAS